MFIEICWLDLHLSFSSGFFYTDVFTHNNIKENKSRFEWSLNDNLVTHLVEWLNIVNTISWSFH